MRLLQRDGDYLVDGQVGVFAPLGSASSRAAGRSAARIVKPSSATQKMHSHSGWRPTLDDLHES